VQYENARIEPMWDTERLEMIDYNTDIYVRPLLLDCRIKRALYAYA
jgi:hypothetical protein